MKNNDKSDVYAAGGGAATWQKQRCYVIPNFFMKFNGETQTALMFL
jgi:hypothetical protein